MTSYESVRELIGSVPKATSTAVRDVRWLTDARIVGISRDDVGRVEVFLRGAKLNPSSRIVGDALEFRSWHREDGARFDASRLLFPGLAHFDQVAAFVCTELLRNGADVTLTQAFAKAEPVVELAIERFRLSREAVLGLAGELLLLDAMCRGAANDRVAQVIESWNGWQRSSRDFAIGNTGVEVKTTTRGTSSHPVQGVHQVEANDGLSGGVPEDRLYLVSIGLQAAESGGNSFTIPFLVDRILKRMEATGSGHDVEKLLYRVAMYGAGVGEGYDHRAMSGDSLYATPFVTSFFRAYDMSSPEIEVLRRDNVVVYHHVEVSSVNFRVELPTIVGPGNPVVGANQVAHLIIKSAE